MLVIEFQVASKQVPMKRPGQPAELATAYVMLADPMSSYVSGATIAVTGGKPCCDAAAKTALHAEATRLEMIDGWVTGIEEGPSRTCQLLVGITELGCPISSAGMRRSKLTGAGMLAESGNPPHLSPKGASDAADRVGIMCERELSDPDLLRMAQVIYVEMTRQMGMNSRAMIDADHNLREVILDGSLDLVRVAAALSKRCCVHPSDVETITESARNPSDLSAVGLGGA